MPTYRLQCQRCRGEFETWNSIHDPLPSTHQSPRDPMSDIPCGGQLVQVFTRVATYGVGEHGASTRSADAREREIDRDRPAYKRLRDEGHQPLHLRGAHELEARATDDWFIKTNGAVSVPDARRAEIDEMLAEGATTSWNPVEQVHAERSA